MSAWSKQRKSRRIGVVTGVVAFVILFSAASLLKQSEDGLLVSAPRLLATSQWIGSTAGSSDSSDGTIGSTAVPSDKSQRQASDLQRLLTQVERDLEPYRGQGIALEQIEQQYCEIPLNTMRFQVVGGKGYVVGEQKGYQSRHHHIKLVLAEVMGKHGNQLPDADFIMFTDDHPVGRQGNPQPCHPDWGPQLVMSKPAGPYPLNGVTGDMFILFPCHTFGGFPASSIAGWREASAQLGKVASNASWGSRKEQLLFRGGRTSDERRRLFDHLLATAEAPQPLFDIAESSGDGVNNPGRRSLEEHCNHKYLLHLQGNSYSARLKWLLACRAAVIFPVDLESDSPDVHLRYHTEFWYHMLKDGENIVFAPPITAANNGTHLAATVGDLRADDARAQRVAQGAAWLAEEVLTMDHVLRYWTHLIRSYAQLQRFSVTRHPDAIPVEESLATVKPQEGPYHKRTCNVCGRWPPDNPL